MNNRTHMAIMASGRRRQPYSRNLLTSGSHVVVFFRMMHCNEAQSCPEVQELYHIQGALYCHLPPILINSVGTASKTYATHEIGGLSSSGRVRPRRVV
jgi:hypothetical protein